MTKNAILAGTGFANPDGSSRADIIRRHVRDGMPATLRREPNNKYDPNAIAVYIVVSRVLGLLGTQERQIGYIKANTAKSLAKRIDGGQEVTARVHSHWAPPERDYPRVTLALEY